MLISTLLASIFISAVSMIPVPEPPAGSSIPKEFNYNITFFDEPNKEDYAKYMEEVFKELENDKNFESQIISAKQTESEDLYAEAFKFANEDTRNKLDDIKRREIERLNAVELKLKKLLKTSKKTENRKKDPLIKKLTVKDTNHIHSTPNPDFTEEALRSLISKIQHNIKMTDMLKERQYQRHEWKKDWKIRKELSDIKDPEERQNVRYKWQKSKRLKIKHKKINEPGSEEQMKETWRNSDNLDSNYFNTKTFFNLHDVNADGQWDIQEIEALLLPEIDKVYTSNDGKVDKVEKYYELMKMRQHFMEKMDTDKDEIVSFKEFETYNKGNEFKKNVEWKLSEDKENLSYTDEDLKMFEMDLASIQQLVKPFSNQNDTEEQQNTENTI